MRNAFADELSKLAVEDPRIIMLSGDIGNRLFDKFKDHAPDRFFNCGVAEANMISVAAGMAMNGLRPIAYTIAPFITYRCYEQIRLDCCYHRQPVIIVGVGAGLSYASLGATHHSCEDIACLRALPEMTVVCPGDAWEVRAALRASLELEGPVYLRLGKKGEPVIHSGIPEFKIGKALPIRSGTQVALLSNGTILPNVLAVADQLEARGVSTAVVSFHTVKPLDQAFLAEAFSQFSLVCAIEEHSRLGGLGGAISEWLCREMPLAAQRFLSIGTPDTFLHEAGEQEHAREVFGLGVDRMLSLIEERL